MRCLTCGDMLDGVTPERKPTVLLVGTLDTKGKEYAYLRDRIRERGVDVLLDRRRHPRRSRSPSRT